MATTELSLAILFLFLTFSSLDLGKSSMTTKLKTWCVAKPSSSNNSLMDNLDYACSLVHHEECNQLKNPSCPCSNPNTIIHRASVAMNAYYQEEGSHQWNCDFRDSALIALTDPSYGDTHFLSDFYSPRLWLLILELHFTITIKYEL